MAGSTTQFRYARAVVQPSLDRLVPSPRPPGRDLDDQFRNPPHVDRRDHLRGALVRQIEQVGLDDVELGQDDIQRGKEDTTDRVLLQPVGDQEVEIARDSLVPGVR
jgi:hypothetical protein